MNHNVREDLRAITDRICPNEWYVMDEVAFERRFGYGHDAQARLASFVSENSLALVREKGLIKLGRAYAKP